jgi:hypothetical protein
MHNSQRHSIAALAAAALGAACQLAAAAPTIAPSPALPSYGQPVAIELRNTDYPVFMPGTRYTRSGNNITIDFEYMGDSFGPWPPNFGAAPVPLGELAPGNYTVQARLYDMNRPGNAPIVTTSNLPVVPPSDWGAYVVPKQPRAFENVEVLIRSAAYFDTSKMRVAVSGNVVRVDFDYLDTPPAAGQPPPGMATYGSVRVGALAPGNYRIEAWGRPTSGGNPERYFTRDFATSTQANVVEYYHEQLDHYFMAANPDEIAMIDAGGQGGWKRTGHRFQAWAKAGDAPPAAKPVCRFYAAGPNSHFYTGDANECQQLRQLEQGERAQAAAEGHKFLGWTYEGVAFYAMVPQAGQCPAATLPVWRAYNKRAQQRDSNHRFTVDPVARASMAGWADEGAVFCSPE